VCVCVRACFSFPACKLQVTCLLSSLAYLVVLYFYTLSHKRQIFGKKKLLNVKCVLFSSTSWAELFLILRRTERDIIKNGHRFHAKYPLFLSELET